MCEREREKKKEKERERERERDFRNDSTKLMYESFDEKCFITPIYYYYSLTTYYASPSFLNFLITS